MGALYGFPHGLRGHSRAGVFLLLLSDGESSHSARRNLGAVTTWAE